MKLKDIEHTKYEDGAIVFSLAEEVLVFERKDFLAVIPQTILEFIKEHANFKKYGYSLHCTILKQNVTMKEVGECTIINTELQDEEMLNAITHLLSIIDMSKMEFDIDEDGGEIIENILLTDGPPNSLPVSKAIEIDTRMKNRGKYDIFRPALFDEE